MELFKLFGTILVDNDAANKSIAKTEQNADKSGSNMMSTFKKVGAAVVAGFSVAKVIEFGKQCVETAASIKASKSQFEQTFGDMQDTANDNMQKIADSSGILKTRLQDVGTSIYAFAKTTGADSATSMDIMSRALQVTADSAAYYDRSLEDTAESLKSFLKGNYENDTALGLSCTETTRNAAANELYGKSFKDLSEAQKQLTLLQMVEDANKLSGAMGQAARESDGYENVMGNLKESWRQFLGIIGSPILSAVIPVIQMATSAVDWLNTNIGTLGTNWDGSMTLMQTLWSTYGAPMFDSLLSMGKTVYDSWNILWPALQTLLDTVFKFWQQGWNGIGKPVFDTLMYLVQMVATLFNKYWPMIANIVADAFNIISRAYNEIFKPIIDLIAYYVQNYLLPTFVVVWGAISGVISACFDTIGQYWNNALKPILNGIISFVNGVFSGNWSKAWDGVKSIVSGVFGAIKTVIEAPMNQAKTVVKSIIDAIKGFFNFKISWPKIPLPHFSVKPAGWEIGDLLKGKIPSLGIEWYANGGIMNQPTMFGFNSISGKAMVGGEAGPEAVAPLSKLEEYYKKWSSEGNDEMIMILKQIRDYLADDERWYRVMLRALTDGSFAIVLDGREVGRIVRKYA